MHAGLEVEYRIPTAEVPIVSNLEQVANYCVLRLTQPTTLSGREMSSNLLHLYFY